MCGVSKLKPINQLERFLPDEYFVSVPAGRCLNPNPLPIESAVAFRRRDHGSGPFRQGVRIFGLTTYGLAFHHHRNHRLDPVITACSVTVNKAPGIDFGIGVP
jgi:hypothetical protein